MNDRKTVPGDWYNIGYSPETHIKLISRKISFSVTYSSVDKSFRNITQSTEVSLPFFPQIFKKDSTTEINVTEQWDFLRFKIVISFVLISRIATAPSTMNGVDVRCIMNWQFAWVLCVEDSKCENINFKEKCKLYLSQKKLTNHFNEPTLQYYQANCR